MSQRVQDTLLVSSMYDTFILQEDGQLGELILGEFLGLNLQHTTGLTHVSSGTEALMLAKEQPTRFNLIITAVNVGDMNAAELAAEVRRARVWTSPWCCLPTTEGSWPISWRATTSRYIERTFLWQGDTRILLAMVKYVEDRMNIAFDSGQAGVQVILLIEDSIRYYSSFLPLVYSEVIRHSDNLLAEGLNVAHKILRKRARPKIILCGTWEEAWEYFTTLQGRDTGHHLGHRVPPGRRTELRSRPPVHQESTGGLAGHTGHPAVGTGRERGGGQVCGRRIPAQGIVHAPDRPPPAHGGTLLFRRFHLPHAERHRSGPRTHHEGVGGSAAHRSGGERDLACGPQPLLALAQGPD